MFDIQVIKQLAGNPEIEDTLVAFYLTSTTDWVKSYCNIEEIPRELNTTLIEITAKRIRANTAGNKSVIGEGMKQIASITDGNQSISYVAGQAVAFTSEEDILKAYGHILNRYRRLVVDRLEP